MIERTREESLSDFKDWMRSKGWCHLREKYPDAEVWQPPTGKCKYVYFVNDKLYCEDIDEIIRPYNTDKQGI